MAAPVPIDRLVKLMMMTTSSFDAEALVAIRKANSLLSSSNANWQDVLRTGFSIHTFDYPPPRRPPPPSPSKRKKKKTIDPRADLINQMFETILAEVSQSSSFREFIVDVQEKWETTGSLTPKQFDAMERAYNRVKAKEGK